MNALNETIYNWFGIQSEVTSMDDVTQSDCEMFADEWNNGEHADQIDADDVYNIVRGMIEDDQF